MTGEPVGRDASTSTSTSAPTSSSAPAPTSASSRSTSASASTSGSADPARVVGRFAPSPTGLLHLGNLRTALVSWCTSRGAGGRWLVRMEDLDPVTSSRDHERRQLDHLARLGLEPDGEVVRQSDRFELHRAVIERLRADGLVYPCFCTRREILDAAAAPHGDGLAEGAYPGTCRELDAASRLRFEREGRRAALRLRTDGERCAFDDLVLGRREGGVDDVVLQRNDGVPAYNLAVVVDDHLQGVNQVVRGDDLAPSTPRQLHLHHLLGFDPPTYAHVPLVVGPDGRRLAKRHGAVTLDDLTDGPPGPGTDDVTVLRMLAAGIGVDLGGVGRGTGQAGGVREVARSIGAAFSLDRLPREPWVFDPGAFAGPSATMSG